MLTEHDILAVNVLPAWYASLTIGVSQSELESSTGWSEENLKKPGATVSAESTYRHLEWIYERADYIDFFNQAVTNFEAANLGVVGLACKTASSLEEAMQCHEKYQRIINQTAAYRSVVENREWRLTEIRNDLSFGAMLMSEYSLAVAVELVAVLIGRRPTVKHFAARRNQFQEGELEVLQDRFGCEIQTGDETAKVIFAAEILTSPVQSSDAEISNYFSQILPGLLPPETLDAKVRHAVSRRLMHGAPKISDIARELSMGERTLQRQLKKSGTSFRVLVEQARTDLAEKYVRRSDLDLIDISFLLGFSDQTSFNRAFKRWFGESPNAFRQS